MHHRKFLLLFASRIKGKNKVKDVILKKESTLSFATINFSSHNYFYETCKFNYLFFLYKIKDCKFWNLEIILIHERLITVRSNALVLTGFSFYLKNQKGLFLKEELPSESVVENNFPIIMLLNQFASLTQASKYCV